MISPYLPPNSLVIMGSSDFLSFSQPASPVIIGQRRRTHSTVRQGLPIQSKATLSYRNYKPRTHRSAPSIHFLPDRDSLYPVNYLFNLCFSIVDHWGDFMTFNLKVALNTFRRKKTWDRLRRYYIVRKCLPKGRLYLFLACKRLSVLG